MNHQTNSFLLILEVLYGHLKDLVRFFWVRRVRFFSLGVVLGIFISFFFLGGAYVVWSGEEARVHKSLEKYRSEVSNFYDSFQPKSVKILDRSGKVMGEFYRRNFRPIRTDNLGKHNVIVWAVLSSEDREFFSHSGLNYTAIGRAVVTNLIQFRLSQGGSTISQQLAKLTLNLGKRNLFNKLTELYCTFYIESQYSKEEILAMYLNQIFLGEGNTGVEEAARYYFRKPASELSPEEAALLVGIIPAPSVYNPVRNLGIALSRQKRVLYDMARNPELHPSQKEIPNKFSDSIELNLKKFKTIYKIKEHKDEEGNPKYSSEIGKYGADKDFRVNLAPDFNSEIRRFILEKFSNEDLEERGLLVYTTLDLEKQRLAEEALRVGVDSVRADLTKQESDYQSKGKADLAEVTRAILPQLSGSMISLDPETGDVEALVGGYKISNVFRFNRAEDARRQPGSTIKALVYALAFEKRIVNPSSKIKDEKLDISGYSPKNWYKGYKGEITVRQALAQSVNTVSVKLLHEIGISYFIQKLSAVLSIPEEEAEARFQRNLSLALGSGELSPMELSLVYATLMNGGRRVTPRKILKITDLDGNEFYNTVPNEAAEQILDPVACAMAINTLQSVLTEEGTMTLKRKEGEPFLYAGKTGTVQSPKLTSSKWKGLKGVRDVWFAGLTPRNVTVVWVGHDEGAPFPGSGSGVSGGIWYRFTQNVKSKLGMGNQLISNFVGDFVKVDVCADDGTIIESTPDYICKVPLYAQYYYIGDLPPKRAGFAKQEPLNQNTNLKPEPMEGDDSEISTYDSQGSRIQPTAVDSVELEPPLIENRRARYNEETP
ncbi:transglycosylase domain-containing protein [Leptospira meyeri]|uniref:transglycosylase domain-containing protein n=1 Tax=Leptospira meyeri TaxID=29508 RepID=UPI000C2B457D|nr:transglycosylase domain-containing protein [Leptospira meyeri]PJZ82011.1 carboxypeptidase [Leptospira meyeri]PJZ97516.1 carboxypeptidase [Leptospira meyeri]